MAGEWIKYTVGDVAVCNPETYSPVEQWDFVNYLDTGNITNGTIDSIQYFTDHESLPSRARRKVRPGDIVYSTVRPNQKHYGIIAEPLPNMLVSTGFAVIRGREGKCETKYLYYFLTQPQLIEHLHSIADNSTSAYPSIKPSDIESLEVELPPLPEQRAIAHILGTLDDKIELNRRMSETLEQMARAIFKSWFVDFDPVRAKMDGRWRKGQTLPGLPAHLYDLFPDRLVDSELGEIPEGWELAPLPDLVEINPSRPLRKGEIAPYLDMANMPIRGHAPDAVVDRPFGSGMRFINGDTLVARITPCLENGKTAFVDFLQDGQVGWGSTEYIVLRPKPPLPEEFAYCLARSHAFREFAIQSMTGTSGRQRVQADSLEHFRLPRVPALVAEAFGRAITPLFARSSSAVRESRTLSAIRDALLPKLISGEIRIKDAEKFVEGAL